MKEIFKQYGDMAIASIVIICLIGILSTLALFGKSGISAVSGGFLDKRLDICDVSGEYDGTGFDSYKRMTATRVLARANMLLYAGETRRVRDLFSTEYGGTTGYEIVQIYDSYGGLVSNEVKKPSDTICLSEPGIYTVYCKSSPVRGLEKIFSIKIPVSRR